MSSACALLFSKRSISGHAKQRCEVFGRFCLAREEIGLASHETCDCSGFCLSVRCHRECVHVCNLAGDRAQEKGMNRASFPILC